MSPEALDWGLVLATYQREALLPKCLRSAAEQTRPPKEIIIVDASPGWERSRKQILHELAPQYPAIAWQYVQANRTSLPTQRNQGIALATADIVFFIDDDSLLYPDCAEEILRIYARDTAHQVVGIMTMPEALPPPSAPSSGQPNPLASLTKTKKHQLKFTLKSRIEHLLRSSTTFPPYDFSYPKHTFPETLKELAVHGIPTLFGFGMTFRRKIFEKIRFEEVLENYAANEDIDISYRAARHGMLMQSLKARVYHLQASSGRLPRFTVTVLSALNIAVLHRFHSPDFEKFKPIFVKLLWQRLVGLTIKDVLTTRWSFPSTRGILFVFRHYQKIFAKTPEELREWYPQFQRNLIERS